MVDESLSNHGELQAETSHQERHARLDLSRRIRHEATLEGRCEEDRHQRATDDLHKRAASRFLVTHGDGEDGASYGRQQQPETGQQYGIHGFLLQGDASGPVRSPVHEVACLTWIDSVIFFVAGATTTSPGYRRSQKAPPFCEGLKRD